MKLNFNENNLNRRQTNPPSPEDFLANLLQMTKSDNPAFINFSNTAESSFTIATSDLVKQICIVLSDVFEAKITAEENNVLKLDFGKEQFKLRINKE